MLKNIDKAAKRIKQAIKNKERIILYGDSDLDGATSVIILQDSIATLGGKVDLLYFPDRESQGYGVNKKALQFLKKYAPGLLITLDCGIGNVEEIDLANKMGFEVMIVDHHEPLDKLPEAGIIVDPKQKGDKYPFKGLSCAGVVFKLAEELLGKKMSQSLQRNFLELVALSTIADMMPRESENKIFIEQGLSYLKNSWRPGIRAFLGAEEFKDCKNLNEKIYRIISVLNVRDVKKGLPASFRLLNSSCQKEVGRIIKELLKKLKIRKEKIEKTVNLIERRLAVKDEPLIFEGSPSFDLSLLSTVASIICRCYEKPVFLYKKMAKETQGTVRSPKNIHSVSLMKKCSAMLLTYGGHAQASGFRVKNSQLEKFRQCLLKNLKK